MGTDSNILIDAAAELCALEYSQRLSHRRRAVLGTEDMPSVGQRLFSSALAGGAQALGTQAGLLAGAPADIAALDMDHPALFGVDEATLLDRLIFGSRDRAIDCVWRGGRRVVSGGRHVAAEEIASRYRRVVAGLVG